MILVRDVFQLHIGNARDAVALAREAMEIEERLGARSPRFLTDLVGDYYTLVWESEWESLSAFETGMNEGFQDPEWKDWYGRFSPLIRGGHREIFTIVE